MLANLIKQHASGHAVAGDFFTVASVLNAIVRTPRTTKAGFVEVISLLGEADTRGTLVVLGADPIGAGGVARLNSPSDQAGLYFAHPITVALIESRRADLPIGAADKLLSLGYSSAPLAGRVVTGDECREAWASQLISEQREALRERFDASLNQVGTSEQPLAVASLRAIADELEVA